jgi:hypothetical protein
VVALSLMAFMLVLIVTLLSLMEVETRSADNNLEIQRAREGARMALNMAIGQLQENAGHDRNITARADIAGNASNRQNHWTGVWDTRTIVNTANTTNPPFVAWLVSGTNPQPANTLDDDNSLELVGANTVDADNTANTDDHVRAPFVNILDANGNVTSRIAWWTSDEGIKASVGQVPLTPASNRPNPNYIPNQSLNSLQTMQPSSQGIEGIFTDYDRFDNLGNAEDLDRVSSLGQLPVLADFADNDNWDLTNGTLTEDLFHTVTPLSLGLLTSTTGSGLMQDLSLFPGLINNQFAAVVSGAASTADANALNPVNSLPVLRHTASLHGINAIGGVVPLDGSISNPVTPVLTNFLLSFAVYETSNVTDANSFVRVHFFCEFWNPYTSSFSMNDGTNDLDLELEISGLPEIQVTASSGVIQTVNLQTVLVLGGSPLVIELPYDQDDPQDEPWYPGMTKNWVGIQAGSPFTSVQDDGEALFLNKAWDDDSYTLGVSPTLSGALRATDPVTDTGFTISHSSATSLSIDVFSNDGAGGKRLLSQIQGVEFDPFATNNIALTANTDSSFSFHFILKGPHQSNGDSNYRGLWLFQNDPRTLGGTASASGYTPVTNGSSPDAVPSRTSKIDGTVNISDTKRLWDRSNDSGTDYFATWQDAPLFEIPRERVLSLASLQHLYFHGERPFRVGNSWGRIENFTDSINTLEWFDKYYFSGLSRTDNPDNYVFGNGLPNPILYPYGFTDPTVTADTALHPNTLITNWIDTDNDNSIGTNDVAKQLAQLSMVTNRFNINSTSVAAWKAVLSGLRINGWRYVDETPNDRSIITPLTEVFNNNDNRKSMFSRFSNSLQETYRAPQTPGDDLLFAATEYYRRGARYLTDTQITALAESIVDQLQTKNSPFISMEEFLANPTNGAGVLEQAITAALPPLNNRDQEWDRSWETTGIVGDDTDRSDIDHFSPGFLTQADIMTAIGPMLAPRSDTFKIRARCETLSPFNSDEVIGDATIEAIVQRVPDPVDPVNDDINDSIERKFKVMSVRWLTKDEI